MYPYTQFYKRKISLEVKFDVKLNFFKIDESLKRNDSIRGFYKRN